MSTLIDDRDDAAPAPKIDLPSHEGMVRCKRCNLSYITNRSSSALRLTYCSFLCELGDLGFSMDGLEHMQRRPEVTPEPEDDAEPEPAVSVD